MNLAALLIIATCQSKAQIVDFGTSAQSSDEIDAHFCVHTVPNGVQVVFSDATLASVSFEAAQATCEQVGVLGKSWQTPVVGDDLYEKMALPFETDALRAAETLAEYFEYTLALEYPMYGFWTGSKSKKSTMFPTPWDYGYYSGYAYESGFVYRVRLDTWRERVLCVEVKD